jgi:hypothetical protein
VISRTPHGCDPAGYLGELRHLPPAERQRAGDWCNLVVGDGQRTMSWMLVVVAEPDG